MDDLKKVYGRAIIEQLFEVSTVDNLETNIVTGFPETRKRQHAVNEVNVQTVTFTPYIPSKALLIMSTTKSNGHTYQQALRFPKINFEYEPTDENATFTDINNVERSITSIPLNSRFVRLRCSCLDFRFRFANYNKQDASLVGRAPPLYIKKTNRPPVNPLQVPGLCKHLLKVIDHLAKDRILIP